MRRTVVALVALACALGCDRGEDVPVAGACAADGDCPSGFVCAQGRYCEAQGGTSGPAPSAPGPGTEGGGQLDAEGLDLDGGRPGSDGGIVSRVDGGACVGAQVPCGGACVDLRSDPRNCGGCGIACTGGAFCDEGTCCDAAGTVCGGACVDLLTDPRNCGVCGLACPQGTECSLGACVTPLPGPAL